MNKITGFVRGHLGAAIAAVAAVIVLVGGVLVLVSAGHGGTPVSTSGTTTTTLAPNQSKKGKGGGGRNVRGQITAINGNTWTVMSTRGGTTTVDITASTTFGPKARPLSASDFAVGDNVVVIGTRSGQTMSATRITRAGKGAGAGSTTTVT